MSTTRTVWLTLAVLVGLVFPVDAPADALEAREIMHLKQSGMSEDVIVDVVRNNPLSSPLTGEQASMLASIGASQRLLAFLSGGQAQAPVGASATVQATPVPRTFPEEPYGKYQPPMAQQPAMTQQPAAPGPQYQTAPQPYAQGQPQYGSPAPGQPTQPPQMTARTAPQGYPRPAPQNTAPARPALVSESICVDESLCSGSSPAARQPYPVIRYAPPVVVQAPAVVSAPPPVVVAAPTYYVAPQYYDYAPPRLYGGWYAGPPGGPVHRPGPPPGYGYGYRSPGRW